MNLFCKGVILGMISGATLASVSIVKDKNFYTLVKDKVEMSENKISKMVNKIKKKIEEDNKKKENKQSEQNENSVVDQNESLDCHNLGSGCCEKNNNCSY